MSDDDIDARQMELVGDIQKLRAECEETVAPLVKEYVRLEGFRVRRVVVFGSEVEFLKNPHAAGRSANFTQGQK